MGLADLDSCGHVGAIGIADAPERDAYAENCEKVNDGRSRSVQHSKESLLNIIAAREIVSGCIGGDHAYIWREGLETVCLCEEGDSRVETIFMKRASSLKAWSGAVLCRACPGAQKRCDGYTEWNYASSFQFDCSVHSEMQEVKSRELIGKHRAGR